MFSENGDRLVVHGLEEGNDISAVLGALEAREVHLGLGDILLGVQQVFKKSLLAPDNTGFLVGRRVSIAGDSSGSATEKTIQVGSLLGRSTLISEQRGKKSKKGYSMHAKDILHLVGSVALGTTGLKKLLSVINVSSATHCQESRI